jgi:hypothetical protein
MPIGAGRLYLKPEENCLRLHTAMGDAVVDDGCRTVRKLRDSARMETSMTQTVRSYSVECRDRVLPNCMLMADGSVIRST